MDQISGPTCAPTCTHFLVFVFREINICGGNCARHGEVRVRSFDNQPLPNPRRPFIRHKGLRAVHRSNSESDFVPEKKRLRSKDGLQIGTRVKSKA